MNEYILGAFMRAHHGCWIEVESGSEHRSGLEPTVAYLQPIQHRKAITDLVFWIEFKAAGRDAGAHVNSQTPACFGAGPAACSEAMAVLFVCVFATVALQAADPSSYSNPVLAGDYPDPSVIRVGDEYWATATTSEWAPLFPLLRSRDLVNWEHVGNIFERRPDWAVGNFWAPELHEHKGTFYVYYVGRKRGGPLSIAVATADKPTGPWTDHGQLIGQDAGSIDAFPVVDTDGTRYLIWKEDGNSRKQPTPLWIQKLSEDGLKLVVEMKEVFRNDTTWENN